MAHPTALLIPDIHKDHGFLERVLAREPIEQHQSIILMGDYFDGRDIDTRGPAAARKTARIICALEAEIGDRLILLWGNHDLPYYVHQRMHQLAHPKTAEIHSWRSILGVAPESQASAQAVSEEWSLKFWQKLRPFAYVHGHLVCHAGLHRSFYPKSRQPVAPALKRLTMRWAQSVRILTDEKVANGILSAGEARGGEPGTVGGLAWLDWEREFADDLPFPQIVAHSSGAVRRQRGRSHCIDYAQSAYGILGEELSIRPI